MRDGTTGPTAEKPFSSTPIVGLMDDLAAHTKDDPLERREKGMWEKGVAPKVPKILNKYN